MAELSSGSNEDRGAHAPQGKTANKAPLLGHGRSSLGESKRSAKPRHSLRDLFEGDGSDSPAAYAAVEGGTVPESAGGALAVGLRDEGKSVSLQSGANQSVAKLESIPEVDRAKEQSR